MISVLKSTIHLHLYCLKSNIRQTAIASTSHSLAMTTITTSNNNNNNNNNNNDNTLQIKKKGIFDFSKYNTRHIALKIAYLGQKFNGFARQGSTEATIERYLIEALINCKLIEDIDKCNFSRCGRTDKGVSALSQVVSLYVRTNFEHGLGVINRKATIDQHSETNPKDDQKDELPYVRMIQTKLPEGIFILGWCPIPLDFSARFSCIYRAYKYFFLKGKLDIAQMNRAAKKLEGIHDFSNFCKKDTSKWRNHIREVNKVVVCDLEPGEYGMCEITVNARSFLWHQVRYMVSILMLIGAGKEDETIIDKLLDGKIFPNKPNFGPAAPENLILFDSGYEGISWQISPHQLLSLVMTFQKTWSEKAVELMMSKKMLESVDDIQLSEVGLDRHETIQQSNTSKHLMGALQNFLIPELNFRRNKYTPIDTQKQKLVQLNQRKRSDLHDEANTSSNKKPKFSNNNESD